MQRETILILDFGSQYTQLIARRLRELSVYSEILPPGTRAKALAARKPLGIVLSGGPDSVYQKGAPRCDLGVFDLGVPLLGVCYGMQLMTRLLGGELTRSLRREYGPAVLQPGDGLLLRGLTPGKRVWMSHGDSIEKAPPGFTSVASSGANPVAAMEARARRLFGLLFHPEVVHTEEGTRVLSNFLDVCGCRRDWTAASFVEDAVAKIRAQVGEKGRVICALSGGVDSAVAALLVHRAIGDKLHCIFVDNGVLREGERGQVEEVFGRMFHLPLITVDASKRFLDALAGVTDPEQKRKIIGREFIEVFEAEVERLSATGERARFLVQGTLYPDVIESVSFKGPSATIKSHHNVGGLPEKMKLGLVEPLRELFKDEVRRLGLELGLPAPIVQRQPFPGPGLAIRVLGEVTEEKLAVVRKADVIVQEEIRAAGLQEKLWQGFAVLLPVRSVGVMGDERTYEATCAIRAIESTDGMTGDWARLPYDLLARMSSRIINEVRGINRVVYDISSKPPATIEWE